MKIKRLVKDRDFMYFWLKHVRDVDLSKHCAKCLVGEYITPKEGVRLFGDIYYMCGVSKPYVWDNNFHLAFRNKPGSIIEVERKGVYVVIEDAEEIPINLSYINHDLKQSKKAEYITCRNWQFANWYNSVVKNNS